MDDAGDVEEDRVELDNVFIDLEIDTSKIYNQQKSVDELPHIYQSSLKDTNRKSALSYLLDDSINKIVMIGLPGSGKSTLMQYLAQIHRARLIGQLQELCHFNNFQDYENCMPRIPFRVILKEYAHKLQDVFTDQEIPYLEDTIRIDYIGLSSMSIGVISILLGDEDLKIEKIGNFDDPDEQKEMKESMLTARVEAIAANTQGNTGATPRWIAVKLGFQKYRFLTFKKYQNDYFLSMLSEGNLGKIKEVEEIIDSKIGEITVNEFSGNLKPFNKLKVNLEQKFKKRRKFPPFNFN